MSTEEEEVVDGTYYLLQTLFFFLFFFYKIICLFILIYFNFWGTQMEQIHCKKGIPTSSLYCPMMPHTFHYHPSSSSNLKGCIVCINVGLVGTYRREGKGMASSLFYIGTYMCTLLRKSLSSRLI